MKHFDLCNLLLDRNVVYYELKLQVWRMYSVRALLFVAFKILNMKTDHISGLQAKVERFYALLKLLFCKEDLLFLAQNKRPFKGRRVFILVLHISIFFPFLSPRLNGGYVREMCLIWFTSAQER